MSVAKPNVIGHQRTVFLLLVAAMLVIAAGHIYLIDGLTTLYLGFPLWLWAHLGVIALLFVLAWFVTGLVTTEEGQ